MTAALDPLCVPPLEPPPGCCYPPPAAPATPLIIFNPPGVSIINYRVGTFTSFRRAMLDAVPQPDPLDDRPNPLLAWREGNAGDYLTTLVELWAYLADVLTFYQERIANEAYLPTATLRGSLLRLAKLIGYRPSPGSGASALVAFTVERARSVVIPSGFRVGAKPTPGKPPPVFETDAVLQALGEHSAIPLSAVAPTNQFVALADFDSLFSGRATARNAGAAAANLYGSAGVAFLRTIAPIDASASGESRFETRSLYRPFLDGRTRTIVLKGTSTRLATGDDILVVEREGSASESQTVRRVIEVVPDKTAGTTTIRWTEPASSSYEQVSLYALRVRAAPFGANAPAWITLPPTLNGTSGGTDGPFKNTNWDNPGDRWAYLPTPAGSGTNTTIGDPDQTLFLDATYDAIKAAPEKPAWAVLTGVDGTPNPLTVHVTDARPVTRTAYATTARVTRLSLRESLPGFNKEDVADAVYQLRGTLVLTGSERVELQALLPLPDGLAGATLVLAGLYPNLSDGQAVALSAYLFDAPGSSRMAESATLSGAPVLDADNNITTVTLTKALAHTYARAGAVLLANLVAASQGETQRDEVLGSSDASANQTYSLKKKPLTYLPSADPEGLFAVQSTLRVTVNGVMWSERPTLLQSLPTNQVYSTELDETGQTTVVFGDGQAGARPPSGRDNIRARYRKGLGTTGHVAAGALQQLLDSAPGVQSATNPQPAYGGADAESLTRLRQNAPASVRTFGRAVSAQDYAAVALTYPGVAMATAAWVVRDPRTLAALAQPYVQLTVVTDDRVPLAEQPVLARNLRQFLDRRRDPNVPLRICDFVAVYVDVAATIEVDERYGRQATLAAAQAALQPGLNADGTPGFFAAERLGLGQSLHLSALYAAIQAVAGVKDATVTTLRLPQADPDPSVVRDDVLVRPPELIVVANDPADTANQHGQLSLTLGPGGFVDT
jgi:predicted phage baseplate assembly protein